MNSQSINDRGAALTACLADAVKAFEVSSAEELACSTWEQLFSNTLCGFKGIGGQAMTHALVVQVCPLSGNGHDGPIRVYVNSRFAYQIERPNDLYVDHMMSCKLIDAGRYTDQYEEK